MIQATLSQGNVFGLLRIDMLIALPETVSKIRVDFLLKFSNLCCSLSRHKLYYKLRLVPSRYLTVFWGERRLGIRLRRERGLMGRDEGT